MKKIISIVVLSLLFSNLSFAGVEEVLKEISDNQSKKNPKKKSMLSVASCNALLSVYSNTNNDGEDKKNSQINKSKRKFNKLTLYPKFSYHFEPRKRYTFIRPLQWFLHNIVKTIKPHRETNCERWEEGDKISRENMMGNNYFVEMNAMN